MSHLVEFWIFPRMVISQVSFPLFDHPQGENKKNIHSVLFSCLLPLSCCCALWEGFDAVFSTPPIAVPNLTSDLEFSHPKPLSQPRTLSFFYAMCSCLHWACFSRPIKHFFLLSENINSFLCIFLVYNLEVLDIHIGWAQTLMMKELPSNSFI